MDIRSVALLNLIKNFNATSHAILAGGAVRDTHYKLAPRDYDIFVPCNTPQGLIDVRQYLTEKLNVTVNLKGTVYGEMTNLMGVLNFKYEDLDVDVIAKINDNDEDFPDEVINTFNFGLNMIYFDGNNVIDTNEKFERDRDRMTMTLYNIKDISELPKAIEKFNSFNDKYTARYGNGFRFECPELYLGSASKKSVDHGALAAKTYSEKIAAKQILGPFYDDGETIIVDLSTANRVLPIANWGVVASNVTNNYLDTPPEPPELPQYFELYQRATDNLRRPLPVADGGTNRTVTAEVLHSQATNRTVTSARDEFVTQRASDRQYQEVAETAVRPDFQQAMQYYKELFDPSTVMLTKSRNRI